LRVHLGVVPRYEPRLLRSERIPETGLRLVGEAQVVVHDPARS
jgi:hypothetical protein